MELIDGARNGSSFKFVMKTVWLKKMMMICLEPFGEKATPMIDAIQLSHFQ